MLAEATDPILILDIKAKLDTRVHYDEYEAERVVKVLPDPQGKQIERIWALDPVAQREVCGREWRFHLD